MLIFLIIAALLALSSAASFASEATVSLEQIDIAADELMHYINSQAASARSPTFDSIEEQLAKFKKSAQDELLSIKKSSNRELLHQLDKRTDKIKEYIDRIQVSKSLRTSLKDNVAAFKNIVKNIIKNEAKEEAPSKVRASSSSSSTASATVAAAPIAVVEGKPFGDPFIRSIIHDPPAQDYVALWRKLSEMKSGKQKARDMQVLIDEFLTQDQITFAAHLADLPINDANREAVHYLESIIQAQNAEIVAALRKHL